MFNMESEEQKTAFWKSMDRRRNGYYKAVTAKIKQHFQTERKAVVKAFESGGKAAAEKAVEKKAAALKKILTAVDNTVMRDFGRETFAQLKSEAEQMEVKAPAGDTFSVFDAEVQRWTGTNVAQKVVLISDTTKTLIQNVIAAGVTEGEGIALIAGRIDTLYLDQIIPNRSTVIARTEVISASNAGNQFAAKQTGLNLEKEWIATRDDRTREAHEDMDGRKADMDKPYKNGLMFPGDPSGPAKEVIQCRCTEGYAVKK
jgi:uncharacterized protein with gpF-like domain